MPAQQQPKSAQTTRPSMNSSAARQPPTKAKKQPQQQEQPPAIPEREIRQNAGVSASMSLQAAKKAWEFRQAMHGAADAQAREQLLAKAINKEVEAQSFGKAAKYTQSGVFQGLAAGAGLGVKPGVTLGKVTGALVGGVVATVTGLLGGGIGSVYGAMNGPMWDLGEIASHGVHGMAKDLLGDWMPDFAATSSQKKALEKMVLQTKNTPTPSKEELEQIRAAAPDDMPRSWSESAQQMTSYIPSMPSMPSKASLPGMPSMGGMKSALGFGSSSRAVPRVEQAQQPTDEMPSDSRSDMRNDPKSTTKVTSDSSKSDAPVDAALRTKRDQASADSVGGTRTNATHAAPARRSATPVKREAAANDSLSTRTTRSKTGKASRGSQQPQGKTGEPSKEQTGQQPPRRKPRKLPRGDDKSAVSTKKAPRKLQVRQASAS